MRRVSSTRQTGAAAGWGKIAGSACTTHIGQSMPMPCEAAGELPPSGAAAAEHVAVSQNDAGEAKARQREMPGASAANTNTASAKRAWSRARAMLIMTLQV